MAVGTLHGMDVVRAAPALIGCIHDHHILVATGHRRMTGKTGTCWIVGMPAVTCPAADPLMNARGGAVIFSPCLMCPVGGMALDADVLHGITGNKDPLTVHIEFRSGKQVSTEVHPV
jgi:hypothetical protein